MPETNPLVLEGELVEVWVQYEGGWWELDGKDLIELLEPLAHRAASPEDRRRLNIYADGANLYGRVRITIERLSDE